MDTQTLKDRIAQYDYWYHKIELPGGIVTPGWAPIDPARYCIPADMTGMRVLDIGAWDGYWTFEALKRGAAEVVAIDDFSDTLGLDIQRSGWKTFDLCREALGFTHSSDALLGNNGILWHNASGQFVQRLQASIYDVNQSYGLFDCVFFFGTLYHLKHPFLALEQIAKVCSGALYVETACLDDCSPYRGGVGHGFSQNERVMEFYPTNEYCANPSNWWAPTLECLGAMMEISGFAGVEAWPLVEKPTDVNECRGFASGTKDPTICPACHPADVTAAPPSLKAKVAAVMSVPRLGFTDNMTCAFEALTPLRIPLLNFQGAFWGQCLERALQECIDKNIDIVLTIDYDSVFTQEDVQRVISLALQHPEALAVVPVQKGRGEYPVLMSMKTRSGQLKHPVPITEFAAETVPIATGHFGLTAIRVSELMKLPHPWFIDEPNADGQWGPGRVDADIHFWKLAEKAGLTTLLACRVPIGHIEAMINWPDEVGQPIYQHTGDFRDKGKPAACWK